MSASAGRGGSICCKVLSLLAWLGTTAMCPGVGVTLITHGYGGNTDGWVTGMADRVPLYYRFPGTNFTTYRITVTKSGGSYFFATTRTNGNAPAVGSSGEIIVKLDWRSLAGGLTPDSTYNLGPATSLALQQTNLIAELGGHALTEFPLHLVGHSRGGSLVCEISRDLGTNGLWVDHLTTLDPHPLNNDGFSDPFIFTTDAPARTYANVLFHDNYWEDLQSYPYGEAVAGGYVRRLTSLSGGYNSEHSNVHLWYHGTIDWRTPASDTETSLGSTQRTNWWVAYEQQGVIGGFYYSLIGGGNRLSGDQPVGQGFPSIRDGFNQQWDLGAGAAGNRTALPSNTGSWPNLITLNRLDTNAVVQGQAAGVKFFYQWAKPAGSLATVRFLLDDDVNPLNGNERLLKEMHMPGTGSGSVGYATASLTLDATNAAPGFHALYATISDGTRNRCLYAPELVEVLSSRERPVLDVRKLSASQVEIGINGLPGQKVVLLNSAVLGIWLPLATNTLTGNRWAYTNTISSAPGESFYRALLP